MDDINLVFTILFTLECILKLIAFRVKVNRATYVRFNSTVVVDYMYLY